MPDLQTLSLLLAVNESEWLLEVMAWVMGSPRVSDFIKARPRFEASLRQHLDSWTQGLRDQLRDEPVPEALSQEFALYQAAQRWTAAEFAQRQEGLLSELKRVSGFHAEASELLLGLQDANLQHRQELFLQKWRTRLVESVISLQMAIADRERERLLKELERRMRITDEVAEALQTPQPGTLWDLSEARLRQGESGLLRQYARFLANNPQLKQIAAELGRAARQDSEHQEHYARIESRVLQHEKQEAIPDDLVGIYQDNQLTRMLPSEAMLLSSPELETVFYKHLVERRLLNYQLMGQSRTHTPRQIERRCHGEQPQPKGPFIVCIDTSASMNGYPEQCAKALCLGLLQIALAEQRDCIVMLFSTQVVSYELTGPNGLQQALNFLGKSFHGGTDLEPCLDEVLARMQSQHYQNADAIVLSDFIAQRLPASLIERTLALKEGGNRFNAVSFSRHGKPGLMQIFDAIWRFDTGLRGRLLRKVS